MKLIIAEKPSLGRNIAAAIGNMKKSNGFLYNNDYIVTWAFGHLFSLEDVEYYSPAKNQNNYWEMDNLPCLPENFKFSIKKNNHLVDEGIKNQFEIIKKLCNRTDIETIINAGDADREGEIIVRLCINNSINTCNNKKIKRLWLPDQTSETILNELKNMHDDSDYDNLANEGFARTYTDWMYGVNLTRYATLKFGKLLRIGRVIIPIVKAIHDRDNDILNFIPKKYYVCKSRNSEDNLDLILESKIKFDIGDKKSLEDYCNKLNTSKIIVSDVKNKKEKLNPGKLFSLSKLQSLLGKKYKMSMVESLSIVQKLYENGYVTYPRTNSEYLATAEKEKVKKIVQTIKDIGYPITFKDGKNIFDDTKIESHSALIPTHKIPPKDSLSENELIVYKTILRRFVAVFCQEECLINKTEATISAGEIESFSVKGSVILTPGWTKFDDNTKKDKYIPSLTKGEELHITFSPYEKTTTPPKHYTIETLNNFLKNPFKEDKSEISDNDDDTEDYKAIFEGLELGTEATRSSIIDNAIKSKYIELKKDVYHILPDGIYLINALNILNISMDKYKTVELSKALKKVFHNEITINESLKIVKEEIKEIFDKENIDNIGKYGDVIGVCPLCGSDVKRSMYGYTCNGYKNGCKFSINQSICKKTISVEIVTELLEKGETHLINGFTSKKGKSFDAKLKLIDNSIKFDFT